MKTGVAHRDAEINDLRAENASLREMIESNERDSDRKFADLSAKLSVLTRDSRKASLNNERHSRSFNLRAFNIPEEANEKTERTIELINQQIKRVTGLDIEIEYGHRTGQKKTDGSHRGVIFRFASRQDRWKVFGKRGEFFTKGIPLYEDLPAADLEEKKKHSAAIKDLYDAKHKVAFVRGHWYVDGNVFNG